MFVPYVHYYNSSVLENIKSDLYLRLLVTDQTANVQMCVVIIPSRFTCRLPLHMLNHSISFDTFLYFSLLEIIDPKMIWKCNAMQSSFTSDYSKSAWMGFSATFITFECIFLNTSLSSVPQNQSLRLLELTVFLLPWCNVHMVFSFQQNCTVIHDGSPPATSEHFHTNIWLIQNASNIYTQAWTSMFFCQYRLTLKQMKIDSSSQIMKTLRM